MATFPCENALACVGTDQPVANLSAEKADVRKFFGYNFFQDQTVVCESEDPDIQQFCNGPAPTNPPIPVVYVNNAQTCQIVCPDSSVISYTAVAGSAVGLSQGEADAAAFAFACQVAQILCSGPLPPIFVNTAQNCTFTCEDGTEVSFTVDAGSVAALSQVQANVLAAAFACSLVALLCPEPPVDLPSGGAGSPPQPPLQPRFANRAQQCSEPCPDGSIFTFTTAAGLFIRDTLAEANAVASAYACRQAELRKICLSNLDQELCADTFSSQLIVATGMPSDLSWSISAGTIPTGMTFEGGQLAGIPTTGGTYTFTVTATDVMGHSASRTYIVDVIQITPAGLPSGMQGTPYSQAVGQVGGALPATFGITGGVLPTGLSLDPASGIISGTPSTPGTFAFEVSVITS